MLEEFLAPGQKYVERENISANPEIATGEEVYDLLLERLPKVISEAWQNRREGSFSNAFGRAAVGMCRRVVYNDDTAQMWGDTNTAVFAALEGGSDSGLELFLDYGNQIKARSRASQSFLIQLANGAEGYLPTKRAEQGGHYSAFISSGQVGHAGGEQLVRETLKYINSMF